MKLLMVDNFDSFTYNLVQIVEELGHDVVTYRNDAGLYVVEKENPDGIIISPGPSSPKNAGMSMKVIEQYAGKRPIFGVCLGMQAMAEVFGTRIRPLSIDEIIHGGSTPIIHDGKTIFTGLKQGFHATRYHSLGAYKDEVTTQVESPLEVSASTVTQGGREIVMGMRHKQYPVEGIQFHPESVLTLRGKAGVKLLQNAIDYVFRSNI